MTNGKHLEKAANDHADTVDSLFGPRRSAALHGFIAGADWMALQIKDRPIDYGLMTQEHHDYLMADRGFAHFDARYVVGWDEGYQDGKHDAIVVVRDGKVTCVMLKPSTVPVFNKAEGKPAGFGFRVVGWDQAAPDGDHSAETVIMSAAQWKAHQAQVDLLKEANGGMQERIEARDAHIAALKDHAMALQNERDKLAADRDSWKATATRYAKELHAARQGTVRLSGEAVRMVPRGPFPSRASYSDLSAEMQANLDASIFGTGVLHTDEDGNTTAIDPREFFGRSLTDHLVKEAGGTGDDGKAEPAATYDLDAVSEMVERYEARISKAESLMHFWKAMSDVRRKENGLIDDMLTEAIELLEDEGPAPVKAMPIDPFPNVEEKLNWICDRLDKIEAALVL